jgi:hypothetical protein
MNQEEIEKKAEQCCKNTYSGYGKNIGIYEPFTNFINETAHNGYSFVIIILIIISSIMWYKMYGKKMLR